MLTYGSRSEPVAETQTHKKRKERKKCLMQVIKIRSVDILIRRNGYITVRKDRIEPRTQGGAGAKFLRMEAQLVRNTYLQSKENKRTRWLTSFSIFLILKLYLHTISCREGETKRRRKWEIRCNNVTCCAYLPIKRHANCHAGRLDLPVPVWPH
jgi:hypothetical protein